MLNVTDWLAPAAIINGLDGCEVDPAGNPESVIAVEPVNPFDAVTEIETAGLAVPKVALTCAGVMETVKSPLVWVMGCEPPPPQFVNRITARMPTEARYSVAGFSSLNFGSRKPIARDSGLHITYFTVTVSNCAPDTT